VAKSGAEGLLLVAEPEQARGIAIKCEDGAMRAMGPAAVELLRVLDVLATEHVDALDAHRRPPVHDAAGHAVGWLEANVESAAAGPAGSGARSSRDDARVASVLPSPAPGTRGVSWGERE